MRISFSIVIIFIFSLGLNYVKEGGELVGIEGAVFDMNLFPVSNAHIKVEGYHENGTLVTKKIIKLREDGGFSDKVPLVDFLGVSVIHESYPETYQSFRLKSNQDLTMAFVIKREGAINLNSIDHIDYFEGQKFLKNKFGSNFYNGLVSIKGKVVENFSGDPIPDILVDFIDKNKNLLIRSKTSSEGTFETKIPPDQEYMMMIFDPKYKIALKPWKKYVKGELLNMKFELFKRKDFIDLKVIDSFGDPIPFSEFKFSGNSYNDNKQRFYTSNYSGEVTVPFLKDGDLTVSVEYLSYRAEYTYKINTREVPTQKVIQLSSQIPDLSGAL